MRRAHEDPELLALVRRHVSAHRPTVNGLPPPKGYAVNPCQPQPGGCAVGRRQRTTDVVAEQALPNSSALRGWRKSSYSGPEGGSCVEVLDGHQAGVPVRDSKTPHAPALVFSTAGWSAFVAAVKVSAVRY